MALADDSDATDVIPIFGYPLGVRRCASGLDCALPLCLLACSAFFARRTRSCRPTSSWCFIVLEDRAKWARRCVLFSVFFSSSKFGCAWTTASGETGSYLSVANASTSSTKTGTPAERSPAFLELTADGILSQSTQKGLLMSSTYSTSQLASGSCSRFDIKRIQAMIEEIMLFAAEVKWMVFRLLCGCVVVVSASSAQGFRTHPLAHGAWWS